jgi:general stress protein YciG
MASKGGKWEISDEEFDRQYAEATRRGKQSSAKGTDAVAARYDKATRQVIVELATGAILIVPARLIQGLQNGTTKALSAIEILGAGSGLYWPKLDVDIGIAGLLAGVFGTRQWMSELGRSGGKASSEAKRSAARANGALGGRPRKKISAPSTRKRPRAA